MPSRVNSSISPAVLMILRPKLAAERMTGADRDTRLAALRKAGTEMIAVADEALDGAFAAADIVDPTTGAGSAPTGVLTVPATGTVGVAVPISFVGTDPEGGTVAWDLFYSTNGSSGGSCCRTGTSASMTFSSPGIYRISVQAIDRELLTSPRYTALISIGGVAGSPPVAEASLSVQSGPAPLSAMRFLCAKCNNSIVCCADANAASPWLEPASALRLGGHRMAAGRRGVRAGRPFPRSRVGETPAGRH